MDIWEVASVLAGVLVVLFILFGIFIIIVMAVLTSGFMIASRKSEKAETRPDHPARHLRPVD